MYIISRVVCNPLITFQHTVATYHSYLLHWIILTLEHTKAVGRNFDVTPYRVTRISYVHTYVVKYGFMNTTHFLAAYKLIVTKIASL